MTMKLLQKFLKQKDKMDSSFHPNIHLEYPYSFPKYQLVYLSPHAQNPLRKYIDDHIYIKTVHHIFILDFKYFNYLSN